MKKLFLGYQTGALLLCTDITEFKLFFLMKLGDKSGYFISEKEPHFFRIPQNFGNRIVALFLSHDFFWMKLNKKKKNRKYRGRLSEISWNTRNDSKWCLFKMAVELESLNG